MASITGSMSTAIARAAGKRASSRWLIDPGPQARSSAVKDAGSRSASASSIAVKRASRSGT
jgi:hypothetical protein